MVLVAEAPLAQVSVLPASVAPLAGLAPQQVKALSLVASATRLRLKPDSHQHFQSPSHFPESKKIECPFSQQLREPAALIIFLRAFRHHVDAMAVLVEEHLAVDEREERPIAARADIVTGDELRPALAHQNAARRDHFAAKSLHAEALADAVASIANTALTFFMCHN